jgi:predicted nucleic acid-binding protein
LRLASNPSVLRAYNATGLTNRGALKTLRMFMARPTVAYRKEPDDIVPLWHQLADLPSASPKRWMDAYLAAFAVTGAMTMLTLDGDFLSFQNTGLAVIVVKPS